MRLPLHPMAFDRIESRRCPECGRPGRLVRLLMGGMLEEWACPDCEPEVFALMGGDDAVLADL